MEVQEGPQKRRQPKRAVKQPEIAAVLPKSKRKRPERNSSRHKASQQRRSTNSTQSEAGETPETPAGARNGEPTQGQPTQEGSWSSAFSYSDDEELPPAVLNSPSKICQVQEFKKFDIVWIKYKTDVYRPCLITNVKEKYVIFKYINQSRKSLWYRARFHKIIRFDNPDQNYKLLNEGRRICPAIVDAYDRVKHFLCRRSEQKDLSPMKYLFFDKTEDLLYGIVPEQESLHQEIKKDKVENDDDSLLNDDEFERPVLESDDDDDSEDEDKEDNDKNNKEDNEGGEDRDIYKKMTQEDKVKLLEKIKVLLKIIESEDCYGHLNRIVEGSEESERMKLLKEGKETELTLISGLGPFFGAERTETDELTDIVEKHVKRMVFSGDLSLLERLVMQPEAIIFALQTYCKLERAAAVDFFRKWNSEIPEWPECPECDKT